MPEDKEVLRLIRENKIDFQKAVIIKSNKKLEYDGTSDETKINISKSGNRKIEFEINAKSDGVVIVSNYFDSERQNKAWVALVDGKRGDILNVN